MSEPLVINRVVGRHGRLQVARVVISIVAGVLLCGACLAAALTQELDKNDQVEALVFGAMGAVSAQWGFQQVPRTRLLLFRGPVVVLDDDGVWVRIGSMEDEAAASADWDAISSVEISAVQLPPQFLATGTGPRGVLRFVIPDESAVQHDPLPAYALIKATTLGLSPVAGTTTIIVGPDTADRIPRILGWLAANRPDLPIEDARS